MPDTRADVALLVDFTDLRQSLEPEEAAGGEEAPEGALSSPEGAPPSDVPSAAQIAQGLMRFAGQLGRVAVARAYADWSRCSALARDVSLARLEPVLVPATEDGEDRSHIRLVVEALETLYTGDEPDAFVLVTGDPTLLPLVQAIRADGSEVVVVAPEDTVAQELRMGADRFVSLEDVLRGADVVPARARTATRGVPRMDGRTRFAREEARRERPAHPTPVASEEDFDAYDWTAFVKLIDELEHRLPFVGVRYLVNKVLGPHNCGVDDPRLKRDLINRAVDDGLIEMYPVGNVGDRSDPVTACRLDRHNQAVVRILGNTTSPESPPEQPRP